jgi:transcriptional antiterminator RfaH
LPRFPLPAGGLTRPGPQDCHARPFASFRLSRFAAGAPGCLRPSLAIEGPTEATGHPRAFVRILGHGPCEDRRFRLSTGPMPDDAFWAVVKTNPQRETFAAERLTERGFEIFLPRVETARSVAPLFRAYLFCRIVNGHFRAIETCFGVLCIVRFGETPARCPTARVESLMDRVGPDGLIRLPPGPVPAARIPIRKGARVKVISGPFAGLFGLYQGQTSRQREIILIACLFGSQRAVAIPRGTLALA